MGKSGETAVVVDVHMREHDALDVAHADPERLELRRGLLFGFDREMDGETKVRMPARQPHQAGRSA